MVDCQLHVMLIGMPKFAYLRYMSELITYSMKFSEGAIFLLFPQVSNRMNILN